jgi:hypothetical protein
MTDNNITTPRPKWTPALDDLLIKSWALPVEELETLLGFEKTAIRRRASYLRGIGVNLPLKKSGGKRGPGRKQMIAAAPPRRQESQSVPAQQWEHGWIGSTAYQARLRAGR